MPGAVGVRYENRREAGDRNQNRIEKVSGDRKAEGPPAPQVLLKRGTEVTDHGHLRAGIGTYRSPASHAMMLAWARHRGPDRVAVSTTRRTWRSPTIFRCP